MNFNSEVKAILYGDTFREASQQQIKEEVDAWKGTQITEFWENLRQVKKILLIKEEELNFSYFVFPAFESQQSTSEALPQIAKKAFNFWEEGEQISFKHELSFHKVMFIGHVNFKSTQFKEQATFANATFYKESNFSYAEFHKSTTYKRAQFRAESEFYHTQFKKKVLFDEVGFHNRTVFHKCTFTEGASFSLVGSKYRITFFSCYAKRISFKYSRIENAYFVQNNFDYLTLHGIAIQSPFFSDNKIQEAERETFAYIKHFFDDRKDYISANYYYAKEMEAYQRELFPKSKASFFKKMYHWFNTPNLGDKLVFGFSKIASDFGQNIFLPLYWIVFSGGLFVGLKGEHRFGFILLTTAIIILLSLFRFGTIKLLKRPINSDLKWLLSLSTFSFISIGIWLYGGHFIGDFSKVINPMRIFKADGNFCQGIELSCLLLRIFITTMMYHFIMASKRAVKR